MKHIVDAQLVRWWSGMSRKSLTNLSVCLKQVNLAALINVSYNRYDKESNPV